ncbi:MAG: N5-glutamine methyltransferase family protein [Actinomycetaceae bacterium]
MGRVDVHGLHLSVGPGVFVPRRRTALLVSVTLAAVREILGRALVVEAFSGVAPVASAVRRSLPGAEVHATDADPAALVHAATNVGVDVANHGDTTANLGDHAHVHRGDVLAGLPPELRGRVDVIAAVPPYVPTGAIDLLPREARDHEPAAALAGGADGLDAVRALVRQARDWLAPGGRVLVEMHRDQVATARELAEQLGYEARHVDGDDGQTAVLVLRGRTGQPG